MALRPAAPAAGHIRLEAAELGERGLIMMDLGDPLEPLYHLCDAADFSMWTLTDPDPLLSFTDAIYARSGHIPLFPGQPGGRRLFHSGRGVRRAAAGLARALCSSQRALCKGHCGFNTEVISYAGNIASASMVGPRYFDQYVYPYEKQLFDFIQARCLGAIYHNCGDGRALIPLYNGLRPRCYESMTEPPYADNDPADFAARCDSSIALTGNIDQIDFLKRATPAEVMARAHALLDIMQGRPFILATSDFLESAPEANLFALSRAAQEA